MSYYFTPSPVVSTSSAAVGIGIGLLVTVLIWGVVSAALSITCMVYLYRLMTAANDPPDRTSRMVWLLLGIFLSGFLVFPAIAIHKERSYQKEGRSQSTQQKVTKKNDTTEWLSKDIDKRTAKLEKAAAGLKRTADPPARTPVEQYSQTFQDFIEEE